jgi:2-polyprenyl-6-hydroxyphenyl methylase/3-demethylubiquinone-9 3-methyltransferase
MSPENLDDRHRAEVQAGRRFEFGANWARFLDDLDEARVTSACDSLKSMLDVDSLAGKTFLDAGCGSGLFSLAALRLGASVRSFDYDPEAVACTIELKRRFAPDAADWVIERGSLLDAPYLSNLGRFDVVYCWGVVHHTGAMWNALRNVAALVAPGGLLFVAVYNDQGRRSRHWLTVKSTYNRLPGYLRPVLLYAAFCRLWCPTFMRDLFKGNPLATWNAYSRTGRGMSPWRDVVDWVGGYPFEVARSEQVVDFCRALGFDLTKMKTQGGGLGCNEFVFRKAPGVAPPARVCAPAPER